MEFNCTTGAEVWNQTFMILRLIQQTFWQCAALNSGWCVFYYIERWWWLLERLTKKSCFDVWLASYEMVEVEQKGSRPNTDY